MHNLRDFAAFSEKTAGRQVKEFDRAVLDAVTVRDVSVLRALLAYCLSNRLLLPGQREKGGDD